MREQEARREQQEQQQNRERQKDRGEGEQPDAEPRGGAAAEDAGSPQVFEAGDSDGSGLVETPENRPPKRGRGRGRSGEGRDGAETPSQDGGPDARAAE
jgi:hypothetical protein